MRWYRHQEKGNAKQGSNDSYCCAGIVAQVLLYMHQTAATAVQTKEAGTAVQSLRDVHCCTVNGMQRLPRWYSEAETAVYEEDTAIHRTDNMLYKQERQVTINCKEKQDALLVVERQVLLRMQYCRLL